MERTSSARNTTTRSLAVVIVEHPGRRQQHQRDVLGLFETFTAQVRGGQQQREHGRREHDGSEEDGEAVDAQHPGDGRHRAVVVDVLPLTPQDRAGREDSGERDDERERCRDRAAAYERAHQHDQHAGAGHTELGRDREPVDVGGRDLGSDAEDHFEPALWAAGIPFAFTPLSATPGSL